jgi:hypothetical protein
MLVGSELLAQRGDTVFYTVGSAIGVDSFQGSIPASSNIGQPYHILFATFSDKPGRTCSSVIKSNSTSPPQLDMEGGSSSSFTLQNPITNYSRIIQPQTQSATNRYRMIASAAGSYPFLSVFLSNWDDNNCQVNVFYSGSLSAIDVKKYADFGTGADLLFTSRVFAIGAGNSTIVNKACDQCRIVVYGLILYNVTAQDVLINDVPSAGQPNPILALTGYAAGGQLVVPNTNYPMFTTGAGGSVVLNLSVGTAVSGMITFRIE